MTEGVRQHAALRTGAGRKGPTVVVRRVRRVLVVWGTLRPGLAAAAPTSRQGPHATLPPRLTRAAVEGVLATCASPPQHLRDHALLLLLARLGRRAHEIVALHVED